MKEFFKRILVIEQEVLVSESEPKHYQTTQHVLNEYPREYYDKLFRILQLIESIEWDKESIMKKIEEILEIDKEIRGMSSK